MKIVVYWDENEKQIARRLADMVRGFITMQYPTVEVLMLPFRNNGFEPYRNDAESLAAEAQRLLDAQEVAFAEPSIFRPSSIAGKTRDLYAWGGKLMRTVIEE